MKSLLLVVLMAVFAMPLHAKSVGNLYDAKVLVSDQSQAARQAGARLGLLEVLQKASGFPVPEDRGVINKALTISDQYLYQFSYATVNTNEVPNALPGSLWLAMQFEEKSIQNLIKKGKLPRWGANRPSVLVWMAVDDGVERMVMSDSIDHAGQQALKSGAEKRGLPIVLPLNDLDDSMALPVEQLWGMFDEPIVTASKRYGAESVLASRIYKTQDKKWKGQWSFYFKGVEQNFIFETNSLEQQVLEGLTASAQVLANSFALKPSNHDANSLSIQVSAVNSLSDYAKLTQYLQKMAITKQVAVRKVNKDRLYMRLELNGTVKQLKQTLALDRKLVPIKRKSDDEEPTGFDVEYFRWNL